MTEQEFTQKTGFAPIQDDLSRANCQETGIGHSHCGWCSFCDKPRFQCSNERPEKLKLTPSQLERLALICIKLEGG